MDEKSISLVIPLYNEQSLIESAVKKSLIELGNQFSDFEIILVDDGSQDSSTEIVVRMAREYPRVRAIKNDINLNIGASLQRGLCAATKKFVVHSAIDMPLPISRLSDFIQQMENCDLLVLERDSFPGYSLWRWVCSQINRFLLKALFHTRMTDLNFSQIYRREIIRDILPLAKSPAFTTPEMIVRAIRKGYRVQSTRCQYLPRPSGKGAFGKPHDILWSLYDMFRFAYGR